MKNKIKMYEFEDYSLWSEPKDAKHWYLLYYSIFKDGLEIHKNGPTSTFAEASNKWCELTGLEWSGQFNREIGSYIYLKNGTTYVQHGKIENEKEFNVFTPLEEVLQINKKLETWNWVFNNSSPTGYSAAIDPRYIVLR